MRHQLGLGSAVSGQYLTWLWKFVRGDMGVSYIDGAAVSGKLLKALPNTLKLTFSSVIVTILLSVPLGILAAVKKGRVTVRGHPFSVALSGTVFRILSYLCCFYTFLP